MQKFRQLLDGLFEEHCRVVEDCSAQVWGGRIRPSNASPIRKSQGRPLAICSCVCSSVNMLRHAWTHHEIAHWCSTCYNMIQRVNDAHKTCTELQIQSQYEYHVVYYNTTPRCGTLYRETAQRDTCLNTA